MEEDLLARSCLYVPAHKPRMIEKSLSLPADIVIYDYEDAVPPSMKIESRSILNEVLPPLPPPNSSRRYIRINHPRHTELFHDDIDAALYLNVEGLVIPKMETKEQVISVSKEISSLEQRHGIDIGSTKLIVLIESPLGLVNAYSICSADSRILAVQFGGEDYSREMGLPLVRTGEDKELLYQRAGAANAASAANVQATDVIWTALDELDGLRLEAAQARRLGFTSKAAVHPSQIEIINSAFNPTSEEIAYSREVINVLEKAIDEGTGVVNHNGVFLEEPVIARARRTIALAQRFGLEL